MGALSLWFSPFAGPCHRVLSLCRIRITDCVAGSVSSWIIPRCFLAAAGDDLETGGSGRDSCCFIVPAVSTNQYRFPVPDRRPSRGEDRFFRSAFSRRYRNACEFFRYCFSRGVSRPQDGACRSNVLARAGHVALRRVGMASALCASVHFRFVSAISRERYGNSPANYHRTAWGPLDVCAGSALWNPFRRDARARKLFVQRSADSKTATL